MRRTGEQHGIFEADRVVFVNRQVVEPNFEAKRRQQTLAPHRDIALCSKPLQIRSLIEELLEQKRRDELLSFVMRVRFSRRKEALVENEVKPLHPMPPLVAMGVRLHGNGQLLPKEAHKLGQIGASLLIVAESYLVRCEAYVLDARKALRVALSGAVMVGIEERGCRA